MIEFPIPQSTPGGNQGNNPIPVPPFTTSFPAQLANQFLAGPVSGAAAVPTFRLLADADLAGGLNPVFGNVEASSLTTYYVAFTGGYGRFAEGVVGGFSCVIFTGGTLALDNGYSFIIGNSSQVYVVVSGVLHLGFNGTLAAAIAASKNVANGIIY